MIGILFITLAVVWLGVVAWALWKWANAMWRDVRHTSTGRPTDPRGFEVVKRNPDKQ